jgi:hypothetical protein
LVTQSVEPLALPLALPKVPLSVKLLALQWD